MASANAHYFTHPINYTNLASLLAKYDELCTLVSELKPSFVLISETWLTPLVTDPPISLDGYAVFRKDRHNNKGGGVCVYISDHICANFAVIPITVDTGNIDSIFLKITNTRLTFLLGCIYRPPTSIIEDDHSLFQCISEMTDVYQHLFIFGDFNMPDIKWPLNASQSCAPSSQLLVDLLLNSHLSQLVTQPTRYRINQNPSTLDLIITSDDNSLAHLEYLDPVGKSDHSTLKANFQICTLSKERTVTYTRAVIDYRSVNKALTDVHWPSLFVTSSVADNWELFKTTVLDLVCKHSASISIKRSSTKPWIGKKILKMVRTKRALWRAFKRSGNQNDYKAHRNFSNNLSVIIREARIAYEKQLADSTDTKRFYRHIRNKLSGPVSTLQLRDDDDKITDDCATVANIFADTFSKTFTLETDSTLPSAIIPKPNVSLDSIEFPEDVICSKLKKLKLSKSPGPDAITASVLAHCAECLSLPLSLLMKQSFTSGILPFDWKTAIVRPIFKKGDKFNPCNYRPISLTSLIVKTMESIIYETLIKFLLDQHLIPEEQHGFLPGKSTISNLLCCLSNWTRHYDSGVPVDVVYLDYSKAFDRVPKRRLLAKLENLGIAGNLLHWIGAFLSDRTFRVRVGDGLSEHRPVLSGVPQGSILGPLLFTAYTADLKVIIQSPFAMYADDIKIYNTSNNQSILKSDLSAIGEWCSVWLLPLNVCKCSVLYIGKNNPQHTYTIDNSKLTKSESLSDLGVFLTSCLSWSEHVQRVVKKANSLVFLLSKVFAKSHFSVVSKFYRTYIRPILEFANSVWAPIFQKDVLLLESVQRKASRIPFGRTRPKYKDRLSMMQLPTLSDRRKRGDLIVTFQALKAPLSPIKHLFPLAHNSRTRGHCLKLSKDKFQTTVRQHFIVNRIFESWNSLPSDIVMCDSISSFKRKYDAYNV